MISYACWLLHHVLSDDLRQQKLELLNDYTSAIIPQACLIASDVVAVQLEFAQVGPFICVHFFQSSVQSVV